MARYTQAVCRICRRSGEKLMLKGDKCITKCVFEKRPKPPGMQLGRPKRLSDRGIQLREKQKVRNSYGLMESQFKRTFKKAERQAGITGENLLVLLERRLDNVVFRLGFAESRSQARQIVQHGHVVVNGRRTDIPSFQVKEGDEITWREGSTNTEYYKTLKIEIEGRQAAGWLEINRKDMKGKVLTMPVAEDIEAKYDVSAIVEYYSR
jgi:small subunit ribosomal protein S4